VRALCSIGIEKFESLIPNRIEISVFRGGLNFYQLAVYRIGLEIDGKTKPLGILDPIRIAYHPRYTHDGSVLLDSLFLAGEAWEDFYIR